MLFLNRAVKLVQRFLYCVIFYMFSYHNYIALSSISHCFFRYNFFYTLCSLTFSLFGKCAQNNANNFAATFFAKVSS